MNEIPTPITRKEQYLAKAAGDNSVVVPDPITREEQYLNAIANNGGGSGGSDLPEVTSDDNGDVLTVVDGAWAKAAPSGGGDLFYVNFLYDENTQGYVVDKTVAEMYAAQQGGKKILGYDDNSMSFAFVTCTDEYAGAIFYGLMSDDDGTKLRVYSYYVETGSNVAELEMWETDYLISAS